MYASSKFFWGLAGYPLGQNANKRARCIIWIIFEDEPSLVLLSGGIIQNKSAILERVQSKQPLKAMLYKCPGSGCALTHSTHSLAHSLTHTMQCAAKTPPPNPQENNQKTVGCSLPDSEKGQSEAESFKSMNIQQESMEVLLESSRLALPAYSAVTFFPKYLIGKLLLPFPKNAGCVLHFPYQACKTMTTPHSWPHFLSKILYLWLRKHEFYWKFLALLRFKIIMIVK